MKCTGHAKQFYKTKLVSFKFVKYIKATRANSFALEQLFKRKIKHIFFNTNAKSQVIF